MPTRTADVAEPIVSLMPESAHGFIPGARSVLFEAAAPPRTGGFQRPAPETGCEVCGFSLPRVAFDTLPVSAAGKCSQHALGSFHPLHLVDEFLSVIQWTEQVESDAPCQHATFAIHHRSAAVANDR